jgi:hypothetical protein
MLRRPALLLALALALPAVAGACGRGGDDEAKIVISQLDRDAVPGEILGLTVDLEDVEERIAGVDRSYIESTGLFSLRDGKELKATLQISRFTSEADIDRDFRLAIVDQIGSTKPRAFRMCDRTVYLTSSKRQAVAVFFRARSFVVLSTLDTYDSGRSLLREVLELEL